MSASYPYTPTYVASIISSLTSKNVFEVELGPRVIKDGYGFDIKFQRRPEASVKLSIEIVSVASVSIVHVNANVAPLSVAI